MKILITGAAGFIGFHLSKRLLARGDEVVGIDSLNEYYDVNLKLSRLAECGISVPACEQKAAVIQSSIHPGYKFIRLKIEDRDELSKIFEREKFKRVCNLAAQAGVRYSLTNPYAYIDSNIMGFVSILECCRNYSIEHLAYASSSSVYGLNEAMPFSTSDSADHPVSLYAASKKANELMAHSYSHLFRLPTTGLRFFTVYGPWGRPDMALFLFTKAILEGRPIDVFNNGEMRRDFTYVDDIVEGLIRVIDNPPAPNPKWDGLKPDPATSTAPYKLFNIGNSAPVRLLDFIEAIESCLGKKAMKNFMPLQPGDVPATWADVYTLESELGYHPATTIRDGVSKFIEWYRKYYAV